MPQRRSASLYSTRYQKYVSNTVIRNVQLYVNGRRREFCMSTVKVRFLLENYCYRSEVLCVYVRTYFVYTALNTYSM